jgi:hypothetical protein
LGALTLTETLVIMVVAGVVFLGVMDGFGLLRRYAAVTSRRIVENGSFYEGYYRLEALVASADSITGGGVATFWRGGAQSATLFLQDSMLIARHGALNDTLMQRVEALRLIHRDAGEQSRIDTVVVIVRTGGGRTVTPAFPVAPPPQTTARQRIEEQEEQYVYE